MDRERLREDLRGCPICNGSAIIEQTGKKQITIKCKNCQLKKVQKHLHYSFEWLWNKMVDDWNKRISDERIKELEEQKIILNKIIDNYEADLEAEMDSFNG